MLSLHKRRPCENNCFGDEYLNITNFKSYCNCILSDNLKKNSMHLLKQWLKHKNADVWLKIKSWILSVHMYLLFDLLTGTFC